jgi:hypothetical protein
MTDRNPVDLVDPYNPWKPCSRLGCRSMGYFSHDLQAVLCDRHFFERRGADKAEGASECEPSFPAAMARAMKSRKA